MKKKVRLRKYRESDLQVLHEALSDEATKRYFPFMYTTCLEQSDLRLRSRLLDQEWGNVNRYLVQDFWTKKPVGEISGRFDRKNKRKMEISIIIHPNSRGKGYANETLELVKQYASEILDLHQLYAYVFTDNLAACKLFKNAGFSVTAELKDWEFRNKKYRDVYLFQLILEQ